MEVYNDSNVRTFAVDSGETTIKIGTRLKLKLTASVVGVATCGATEKSIGVADMEYSSSTTTANPAQGIAVRLNGQPQVFIAGAAIPAVSVLKAVADGKVEKVATPAATDLNFVAFHAAAGDKERITAYQLG